MSQTPPSQLQPWPEADAAVLAPVQEHEDLRTVMRDLLETHAAQDQVRASLATEVGYSTKLWTLLNQEMDVSALVAAEASGGLGFGVRVLGVMLEESGRALLPEPVLTSAALGSFALTAVGAEPLPEDLVDGVLTGRLVATVAEGAVAESRVVAAERGAAWVVTGVVGRVLQGAESDLLVVPASTGAADGLFVVDLRGPGVRCSPLKVLDLTRRQAKTDLDSAVAHLVAGPGQVASALSTLATLRTVALAAEQVGMVDALLQMTRTHTMQRHQFGRQLASFQVVKHRLADQLLDLERARSAARYAAVAFDADAASAALPAAVAGAICTDAVIRVAQDAVQLHGGVGFTWEHPAHLYLRRGLSDEAYGDARSHRAEVARLLGV